MGIEQTDIGSSDKMNSTCVQPVIAAGAGGYHHHRQSVIGQGPLMLSQSPEPAWQYGGSMVAMSAMVKQEPIDEARNDSGITSGSDGCPSASPGSDRSENHPYNSPLQNNNHQPVHNATQFMNTPHYQQWYRSNFMTSPNRTEPNPDTQDTNSQISNGSNGYQPSLSPKVESGDEIDPEQDIRVPKVNSHGKIKVHKCKQCEFIAYTKLDFWEHSKMHIKGDKILKCPKCPFVTEYKHHLEYHLLNHAGAKPFKCDRCDYSCVNKSMLNSHLKSHSKIYQYRCQDCLYETKYCHSLKLHLRKYKHKPAMVLNPDGSPNPLPIIDVYGTRRGPKVKRSSQSGLLHDEDSMSPPVNTSMEHNPQSPLIPNPFSSLMMNQGQLPFPFPLLPGFPGTVPNPEILQNIQRIMRERFEEMQRQNQATELNESNSETVLDLSKHPNDETTDQSEDDEESQIGHTTMFSNVEVVDDEKNEQNHEIMEESTADSTIQEKSDEMENKSLNNNNKYDFSCQFCEISFNNEVMFRIHMGYHGFKSVFTCNMCGEDCNDKVNFFLHIARAAH